MTRRARTEEKQQQEKRYFSSKSIGKSTKEKKGLSLRRARLRKEKKTEGNSFTLLSSLFFLPDLFDGNQLSAEQELRFLSPLNQWGRGKAGRSKRITSHEGKGDTFLYFLRRYEEGRVFSSSSSSWPFPLLFLAWGFWLNFIQ